MRMGFGVRAMRAHLVSRGEQGRRPQAWKGAADGSGALGGCQDNCEHRRVRPGGPPARGVWGKASWGAGGPPGRGAGRDAEPYCAQFLKGQVVEGCPLGPAPPVGIPDRGPAAAMREVTWEAPPWGHCRATRSETSGGK